MTATASAGPQEISAAVIGLTWGSGLLARPWDTAWALEEHESRNTAKYKRAISRDQLLETKTVSFHKWMDWEVA